MDKLISVSRGDKQRDTEVKERLIKDHPIDTGDTKNVQSGKHASKI